MTFHYTWLVWSSAFLLPWGLLYALFPQHRVAMWGASVFMALFGLTEPIFLPRYWNPPTLFELAQRTGFDIESLIFCFAIGGVGAVSYNFLPRRELVPLSKAERGAHRHRIHAVALAAPFALFVPLYVLPWNPIYPS